MKDPHPWIDVSRHPLVVFRVPESATQPEVLQALYNAWFQWLTDNPAPFVVIVDLSQMTSVPNATVRRIIAEGENRTAALETSYNKGNAIVISNPLVRGGMTAVYWVSSPKFPWRFFGTAAEAEHWVMQQGTRHGLFAATAAAQP